MALESAEIYLVSELEDSFVERVFLKPAPGAQEALDRAFARLGLDATVLAMPYGALRPMPIAQSLLPNPYCLNLSVDA